MPSRKEAKQRLRREMLAIRRSLSAEEIKKGSEDIAAYFCAWPQYRDAKIVMLYLSMADEPQMAPLIEHAWSSGKQVVVPLMGEVYGVMEGAVLDSWGDLVTGRLGLKMPDPVKTRPIDPACLDLIVVPGVAFDPAGRRLGMGAGYYDRFLPQAVRACKVGLAWSAQIVPEVPTDMHDVRMDYLLTEAGFRPLSGG